MSLVLETPQRSQNTINSFILPQFTQSSAWKIYFSLLLPFLRRNLLLFNTATFSKAGMGSHSSCVALTFPGLTLGRSLACRREWMKLPQVWERKTHRERRQRKFKAESAAEAGKRTSGLSLFSPRPLPPGRVCSPSFLITSCHLSSRYSAVIWDRKIKAYQRNLCFQRWGERAEHGISCPSFVMECNG